MEYPKTEITPLLIDVINDNPTYDFPVQSISTELYNMLLSPEEFDYFMMMIYRKLNQEHPKIFSEVFLSIMEIVFETRFRHPDTYPIEVYQEKMDEVMTTLEKLKITRIEKDSSDGQMMTAML